MQFGLQGMDADIQNFAGFKNCVVLSNAEGFDRDICLQIIVWARIFNVNCKKEEILPTRM